jgi:hypothetical protein
MTSKDILPETLDDHPFSYWRDTINDLVEVRDDPYGLIGTGVVRNDEPDSRFDEVDEN